MILTKTLRGILIAGVFLVLLIPLYVSNSLFFPFITGKGFAFRIIVEILIAGWAALALIDPRYRIRKSYIFFALVAFVAIIALADIFGAYPYKSFWSNYERMEGWITLIHLLAYFVVTAAVLNTERLWNWFWNISIGCSLITAIYGFFQLAGKAEIHQGGVRLDATLGNATYLAVYLMFHIFITAYLVLSPRLFIGYSSRGAQKTRTKLLVGVPIVIILFIALYYTATRGALLGIVAGAFITSTFIAIFEKERKVVRRTAVGIVVLAIVVVGGFFFVKNTSYVKSSPVLSRFSEISLSESTTQSRFMIWSMALNGFKERPILGWGQENFSYVFNKYYNPAMYNQEQWFDRTHNIIFDWLIAGGILGLAAYLTFFGSIVWYIWRKRDSNFSIIEKSILTGLLVGYFINNLFVFDNITSYILFFSIAAYVYVRTAPAFSGERKVHKNRFAAPVAVVVAVAMIYFLNLKALDANKALITAVATSSPNMSQVATHFQQALAYNSFGTPEIREQIASISQNRLSSEAAYNKQDLFDLAISELKKQTQEKPGDTRYYVILGALEVRTGKPKDGLADLQTALKTSPNKQQIMFEVGGAYEALNDINNAVAIYKQAYEVDKSDTDAALKYAAGLIEINNTKEANAILSTLSTTTVVHSGDVLKAYYDTKKYTKLVEAWKFRVAEDPSKPESHLSLAGAYLLVKDYKNTAAEIRTIIDLDPSFKDQGEAYLQELKAMGAK